MTEGSFEFQRWPVYQRALDFVEQSYLLCSELPKDSATGIRDQLKRASQSIPLNIAEGSSRSTGRDKANFFRIARGSVFECVAILDLTKKLSLIGRDLDHLQANLETVGKMLSGLIRYVEGLEYKSRKGSHRPATPGLD